MTFDALLTYSMRDFIFVVPTLFILIVFSALLSTFLFDNIDSLLAPWSSTTISSAFLLGTLLKFNELADEDKFAVIVELVGD